MLYAELGDITALACELLRAQDTLLSSNLFFWPNVGRREVG
jgi:hypothetical protein